MNRGIQTLHGVGHTVSHKRVQTDFEDNGDEQGNLPVVPVPEQPVKLLYDNFNLFLRSGLNTFIFTVFDYLDEMTLMDGDEELKKKIEDLVGPNYYKDCQQTVTALAEVTSFEFFTWSRFLKTDNNRFKLKEIDDICYHPRTLQFLKKYFGIIDFKQVVGL